MAQEQLAVVLAHAPREVRFPFALELGVDQDQFTISGLQLHLCDQVHGPLAATRQVHERFLVQENHGPEIDDRRLVGQEQLDELTEELADQRLEHLVVIDGHIQSCPPSAGHFRRRPNVARQPGRGNAVAATWAWSLLRSSRNGVIRRSQPHPSPAGGTWRACASRPGS